MKQVTQPLQHGPVLSELFAGQRADRCGCEGDATYLFSLVTQFRSGHPIGIRAANLRPVW